MPHPDVDLLTAFAEQALVGGERDRVLNHLAYCEDCRQVVALASPETEAVTPVDRRSRPGIGWLSWPALRWGFVAAGIVVIASIGILQYKERSRENHLVAVNLATHEQPASAQSTASINKPAPQAMASQPDNASEPEMSKPVATATRKQPSAWQASPPNPSWPNKGPAFAANPIAVLNRPMPRSGSAVAGGRFSGVGGTHTPATGSSTHAFPSASGNSATLAEVSPSPEAEGSQQESTDQAEALSRAKPASKGATAANIAPAPMLRSDPSLMKGRALRWTISASGGLQRSSDGGTTWQDVIVTVDESMSVNLVRLMTSQASAQAAGQAQAAPSLQPEAKMSATSKNSAAPSATKAGSPLGPEGTVFHALSVSSNSAEVWAGGSGAVLYHTIDGGNRWFRVVPTDGGSVLTGDVTGIEFSDVGNGSVRTSTAELWTTPDNGQTWHKLQ